VALFPFACRWILSKLNGAVAATVKGLEAYEFSAATSVSGLCVCEGRALLDFSQLSTLSWPVVADILSYRPNSDV
jgi:hypothetical protein